MIALLTLALFAVGEEKLEKECRAAKVVAVVYRHHPFKLDEADRKKLLDAFKVKSIWEDSFTPGVPVVRLQFDERSFGIISVHGKGKQRVMELQGKDGAVAIDPAIIEPLNEILSKKLGRKADVTKYDP